MAYVCEKCGELVDDNKLCSCLIEDKKELLKKRNKKYYIRKKKYDSLKENILNGRNIEENYEDFISFDFSKLKEDKFLNQEKAAEIIYEYIINRIR